MICIQGAAAVTDFGCLHFSPALNLVLSVLVVRLILSRRHHPRGPRFQSFSAVGGAVAARHRRESAFVPVAPLPGYGSRINCAAMRSDLPTLLDALETCARLFESVYAPSPRRCYKPLLETINSMRAAVWSWTGSARTPFGHLGNTTIPRC